MLGADGALQHFTTVMAFLRLRLLRNNYSLLNNGGKPAPCAMHGAGLIDGNDISVCTNCTQADYQLTLFRIIVETGFPFLS